MKAESVWQIGAKLSISATVGRSLIIAFLQSVMCVCLLMRCVYCVAVLCKLLM